MDKDCSSCYFEEGCEEKTICEHYYPIYDEPSERKINRIIENGRKDFYKEWFDYIDGEYEE